MCQKTSNITSNKQQWRHIASVNSWALQNLCNPRVPIGANKMVSKGWMKKDHRRLQKIYVIWYSFSVLGERFARPFEYKQLLFARSWSS